MKIALYYHTLKYLKWTQIFHRLLPSLFSKKAFLCTQQKVEKRNTEARALVCAQQKKHYFEDNTISLLNHRVNIDSHTIWNDQSQEKLWLYNLHYFAALNVKDEEQVAKAYQLLERWVDENPPFEGNGWEPYPISLRIVNIIKYALNGHLVSERITESLYLQARYLNRHCEYHLLGNHLFENYKALCFAGLYFDTAESSRWFSKGFNGLKKEVSVQILSDGGHFELSPMYHCLILEGLLDLENIFQFYQKTPVFPWKNEIQKMLQWLERMRRPNNEISYFNDASNDIAASPDELFSYAALLGYEIAKNNAPLTRLLNSGYVIVEKEDIKAIMDVGPVGPDYLPGHAHADTLSFELFIDGYPVFVNLGVSCYGISARRLFERGTRSHNTVCVDGKNSSEIWSGFRVARRAYPKNVVISDDNNAISISASHDGYTRFSKNLFHQRQWIFSENKLVITDRVSQPKPSLAYFHLHPDCKIVSESKKNVVIELPNQKTVLCETLNEFSVIDNDYAQAFGKKAKTKSLLNHFFNTATIEITCRL